MSNHYKRVFPIGTRVRALDDDTMWEGVVTSHTTDPDDEDGLIVTFLDGSWLEYPYSTIDLENYDRSWVIPMREEKNG